MISSPLVSCTVLTNKRDKRNHVIDTITIHHAAAVKASAADIGRVFANTSREASSNYGIGYNGEIGLYVPEDYRAWTSSSRSNDHRAVTIEVANSSGAPDWKVSDASMNSLIKLCADICKRNNIKKLMWRGDKKLIGQIDKQNMTVHRWFAETNCPGDYLYSKMGEIADRVNELLFEEEINNMDISKFINELTEKQAYQILEKATKHLNSLVPSKYAVDACKKGVSNKIFSDGDGDSIIDYPQAYLKRQEFAVILDRLGLIK